MSSVLGYVDDPRPMFIPGYTGCCPQYRHRDNDPYGTSSNGLPTTEHTDEFALSDRNEYHFDLYRPSQKDKNVMTNRVTHGSSIYQHPMVPGYGGFVPRLDSQFGHTYGVQATEAFSDFEQLQQEDESQLKISEAYKHHMEAQDETDLITDTELPVSSVRPKNLKGIDNPKERINQKRKGIDIDLPADYSRFGHTRHPAMNPILCDVKSDYQGKENTDWAPDSLDPPGLNIASEVLYHKDKGMMPNYTGHIPGAAFRCGRTFSGGSKGAKQRME